MSFFDEVKRRRKQRETARRPAFGIVDTPASMPAPAQTTAAPERTIEPALYGLVPRAQIRADRACADPESDAVAESIARGEWQAAAAALERAGTDWERRYMLVRAMADAGGEDDGAWLQAWMRERPDDTAVLTVHARSLIRLAWRIRGGSWGRDVTSDQWEAFFRVLRQVPGVCARAAALDPADPTPHIVMLGAAMGLSLPNDEFRGLWAEVEKRAPYHVEAHLAAMTYWLPRWKGSTELVTAFVGDAIRRAPAGSLLTMARLEMIYFEAQLLKQDERTALYRGDEVAAAVDEALRDAAAADPAHWSLPAQRHWLAYFLTQAGRGAEAVEQFRLVGGYCGAYPWSVFSDPVAKFVQTRAQAVLDWEDAGQPPPRR